jgi:hypothetical protein
VIDDCGSSIHYGRISLRVGIFLESLYILGEFPWELAASSCGWTEYWTLGRVGANWRIGNCKLLSTGLSLALEVVVHTFLRVETCHLQDCYFCTKS